MATAHSPGCRKKHTTQLCQHPQLNNLWSVWYCTMALAFQIYIVANSIQRFTRYITLPWPAHDQPYLELNAYVGFVGAAVVMMPFFVAAAMLKVGNHANDGTKIGCDQSDNAVYQNVKSRKCARWLKLIWRHGGPTAPFLHLTTAFCLLMPRVFIHAQLIKHGFLSKGDLWKTDLDFMITHKERLVVLSFLSPVNETEVWTKEVADAQSPRTRTEVQLEEVLPVSSEFMNYAVALAVYAVRYPSVFWRSSKSFGLLFSLQLVLTGLQQLLAFTGFAVLYKVHIYGARDVLLRFSPFLLNVPLAVLLFLVYNVSMTLSGSVLYMYGVHKLREWQEFCIQRHHITWKKEAWRLWGYIPHVSAFLMLLIMASTAAPLTYDYTLVYCGSLDGVILATVTGTVMHLFLWIVLWLFLTVKQRWRFVTEGCSLDSGLCNGHVPQGAGDSGELQKFRAAGREAPLLVVDSGQTYQIRERASKRAILNLAHKSVASQKHSSTDDDDIYWLKPKPPSPKETKQSPEADRLTWLKNQRKSPATKHKVTFEETLMSSSPCRRSRSVTKSPKSAAKAKKQNVKFEDLSESGSEDGDYATLRDMSQDGEDEDFEGDPSRRILCPLGGAADGLVEPQGEDEDADYEMIPAQCSPGHQLSTSAVVHSGTPLGSTTPKSTRSTDSGASKGSIDDRCHGNHSPRSGSLSESSTSPEKGGGSDSSSGVHSTSTIGDKRSTSMENLVQMPLPMPSPTSWKSMSLHRAPSGVQYHPDGTVYYDPRETTMVIWRNSPKKSAPDGTSRRDPFGRATNMRMTSFTEHHDYDPNSTKLIPKPHAIHKAHTIGHYTRPAVAAFLGQRLQNDPVNYPVTVSGDTKNYMSHC